MQNPFPYRVLLANPRLLRSLEVSGAGRFVESGTDEDEAHGWYGRRKKRRGGALCNFPNLLPIFTVSASFVEGTHTPRMAHSAR
jgi:hypothetical protein